MRVDSVVVIHAEHLFTGSTKRRLVMPSPAEQIACFWMLQSFALSAMAVTALAAGCTTFFLPSLSASTEWNGGKKSSLTLVKP